MRTRHVFAAALVLAACADLTKYSEEGKALATQYGAKLASLVKENDSLLAKVKSLPAELPGVSDLLEKVGANRDKLSKLSGLAEGFQAKLAGAIQAGNEEGVTGLLEGFKKEMAKGVGEAGEAVTKLTGELQGLEAKIAAARAAAAFEKTLPGGFALTGNPNGVEAQLVKFIESPAPVDQTSWFEFDRLLFKTGKAELDMDRSKEQIVNIAEVLKAYPNVKLKVGGYTDNTGNPTANKKLSADRARAVVAQLVERKVAKERLAPEGYGSEHPICPANDSDECRAKNRRVSVRVTYK